VATNEVSIKVTYEDATSREIELGSCADSIAANVEALAQAVNTSISGGTDGGLSTFIVSDNGSPMVKISEAKVTSTEVSYLD